MLTLILFERFPTFGLSKALTKNYFQLKIISPYPKIYMWMNGIRGSQINYPKNFYIKKIYERLPVLAKIFPKIKFIDYEIQAIESINKETKLIDVWSQRALEIFSSVDSEVIKILECGSTHILHQNKVLQNEYRKINKNYLMPEQVMIDRIIKEYELANYIVVPSIQCKETFVNYGINKEKIKVINYGIDTSYVKRAYTPSNKFRILTISQLSVRKGIHNLIEAVNQINNNTIELILVGELTDDIKDYIMLNGLRNNIKLVKPTKYKKLFKYYQEAEIFCLPSAEEGLARVLIESLASGLPVLASVQTGIKDLIRQGEGGIIMEDGSVNEIKRNLQEIIKSRNNVFKMKDYLMSIDLNNYSLNKYSQKYIEMIEEIKKK